MNERYVKLVIWPLYIIMICVLFGGGITVFSGYAAGDQAKIPAKQTHKSNDSGSGKIKLAWENAPGADSYNLYVSKVPGAKSTGEKITNVSNPITLTDLEIGINYYFVVTTVDNGVDSAPSNELSFYVDE